jgi:hypothetical protein
MGRGSSGNFWMVTAGLAAGQVVPGGLATAPSPPPACPAGRVRVASGRVPGRRINLALKLVA